MADLTFTTIEESARHSLNISRDEYAACNYIQTWASFPSSNTPGFCNRTRGQMASFVGISERGMQKMLTRLEGMDLIKRASQTQFLYRITEKWFDVVVSAKEQRTGEQSSRQGVNKVPGGGEQSSRQGVNKVPGGGEQSSRQGVNKVPTHKEYNKEVNKQQQKAKIDVAVFDPIENVLLIDSIPLEAEKEKAPPVAPHPPAESPARRWDAFDIDTEAAALKADQMAAERFARETGTTAAQMHQALAVMVGSFTADQKSTGYNYNTAIDYRKHFFNLVRRKQEIKRNGTQQPGQQNRPATSALPLSLQKMVGK